MKAILLAALAAFSLSAHAQLPPVGSVVMGFVPACTTRVFGEELWETWKAHGVENAGALIKMRLPECAVFRGAFFVEEVYAEGVIDLSKSATTARFVKMRGADDKTYYGIVLGAPAERS